MVKVALLYAAGTNCDQEMAQAFTLAGARVSYVHINEAKKDPPLLRRFQVLGIPGGFTYGDYIAAGVILANELRFSLRDEVTRFIEDGKLILGVCNGFQVMVRAGILPGNGGYFSEPSVTLMANDSRRFECRWVHLQPRSPKCVFLQGIDRTIFLPVAHAEGKLVADKRATLKALVSSEQVAVTYVSPEAGNGEPGNAKCKVQSAKCKVQSDRTTDDGRRIEERIPLPQLRVTEYPWNPNGSEMDIAGICDPTGRVFGLMPHPERFVRWTQHPRWTRTRSMSKVKCQMSNARSGINDDVPDGLLIYRNAVNYAKKNL
jgi:phosphoribosylformylglycinamidine synthase